jgi:hypothetical protein
LPELDQTLRGDRDRAVRAVPVVGESVSVSTPQNTGSGSSNDHPVLRAAAHAS